MNQKNNLLWNYFNINISKCNTQKLKSPSVTLWHSNGVLFCFWFVIPVKNFCFMCTCGSFWHHQCTESFTLCQLQYGVNVSFAACQLKHSIQMRLFSQHVYHYLSVLNYQCYFKKLSFLPNTVYTNSICKFYSLYSVWTLQWQSTWCYFLFNFAIKYIYKNS